MHKCIRSEYAHTRASRSPVQSIHSSVRRRRSNVSRVSFLLFSLARALASGDTRISIQTGSLAQAGERARETPPEEDSRERFATSPPRYRRCGEDKHAESSGKKKRVGVREERPDATSAKNPRC